MSSFLASLLLGSIAPIDISDVCGMNLFDIRNNQWSQPLLELVAGSAEGGYQAGMGVAKRPKDFVDLLRARLA